MGQYTSETKDKRKKHRRRPYKDSSRRYTSGGEESSKSGSTRPTVYYLLFFYRLHTLVFRSHLPTTRSNPPPSVRRLDFHNYTPFFKLDVHFLTSSVRVYFVLRQQFVSLDTTESSTRSMEKEGHIDVHPHDLLEACLVCRESLS